jgi:hypothetical protein
MIFVLNNKIEVGVQVSDVMMNCNEIEFEQLLEQTQVKLIAVKKVYDEIIDLLKRKKKTIRNGR